MNVDRSPPDGKVHDLCFPRAARIVPRVDAATGGYRRCEELLRVRHDVNQIIGVAFDREVETPASVHPGLPDASRLVVLLRSEGGVAEIGHQEGDASVKRPLDVRGSARVASAEALSVVKLHLRFSRLLRFLSTTKRADHILG